MIDTSWGSIRIALVLVMAIIWGYILNHPAEDDG